MNNLDQEQQLIRRYLLHDLPNNEREQFEERVIADPEFQEVTSLIEDELIDDYIGDRLSAVEQEKFNRYYLSVPQQQQKLQIALLLSERAEMPKAMPVAASASRPSPSPVNFQPALRWALVGVVGLVVVTIIWIGVRPGTDVRATLEKKIIKINGDPNVTPNLTVKLTIGTRSSQKSQNITLAPGVEIIQLDLNSWPANYGNCEFLLKVTGGPDVFAVPCTQPESGKILTLKIPTENLAHQDYQLSVLGTRDGGPLEEIENYSFRVLK